MRRPLYTVMINGVGTVEPGNDWPLCVTRETQSGLTYVVRSLTVVGAPTHHAAWNLIVGPVYNYNTSVEHTYTPVFLAGSWTTRTATDFGTTPTWAWNGSLVVPTPGRLLFQNKGTSERLSVTVSGWKLVWPTPTNIEKPGTAITSPSTVP